MQVHDRGAPAAEQADNVEGVLGLAADAQERITLHQKALLAITRGEGGRVLDNRDHDPDARPARGPARGQLDHLGRIAAPAADVAQVQDVRFVTCGRH